MRRRLDAELVRRGLAPSRTEAQAAIDAGLVTVAGAPATKPARMVAPGEPIVVEGPARRFVSRGGDKLEAALDRFEIDVTGRFALDAGSSTGGFTDCLLQRGAAHVTAVDVGRAQLHEKLRADARVTSVERTDIRNFRSDQPFELVVADVSFISLATVAPALVGDLAGPGADIVVLVKPQFEAGRAEVSKGRGVIRDPDLWDAAIERAASALRASGAAMMEAMVSPLTGADGNVEFLLHGLAHSPDADATSTSFDAAALAAEAARAGTEAG